MFTPIRTAFTIVEALVATAVVGIAGAALAASLTASAALRHRGSASVAASGLVASRLAWLAVRSCSAADTSGSAVIGGTSERWSVRRVGAGWAYDESIELAPRAIHTAGSVPCRP